MKFISKLVLPVSIFMIIAASAFAYKPEGNGKDWAVTVSIADQKTYIYQNNKLVRTMICSTGIEDGDNDTPTGNYILNETGQKRGTFFYSKKVGEGGKYWVGFIGGVYLFHSVPVTENGDIIPQEAAKLGKAASHGCIRLSMDDAKWFYLTVPDGASVYIQKESHKL